ncbi:molecular chaperone Skp [Sporomusa aerivorans]|uniref:molecular chaperone Skp n=1 Tax=Sporomusa aerivorans TaxID=204936 RepID=UPI00352A6A81
MLTLKSTPIRFLVTLMLGAVLLTGCSRSPSETKPPLASQAGVIDMDKAAQYHPKYQEWQKLKQQAAALQEQITVAAGKTNAKAPDQAMNMAGNMAEGLKAAGEQAFKVKMAAKQQELQARLNEKANQVHKELSAQLKTYSEQLDKEYQPQIFNLQLKLQTVRMDEKEAAEVKKSMDELKAEQAGKLAAKEKELAGSLEKALLPEQTAMEQELAAYAQQLNAELESRIAAESTALSAKLTQSAVQDPAQPVAGGLEQQLGMKQQEIKVLEEYIWNDIRDKAGKVAAERGLEIVLTGHTVNISAVDITDAVIAAFKK